MTNAVPGLDASDEETTPLHGFLGRLSTTEGNWCGIASSPT